MSLPLDHRRSPPDPLVLHDLTLGYDRHPAVHHLSLTIEPGSMVAVVGPNGAGKSTLVKALAGRLKPLGGHLHGLDARRVAWLPQHSALDRGFPLTVRELVAQGLWLELGALGRMHQQHREAVQQAIVAVGLTGFEDRGIDTLSGGQLQRALFARIIVQDAPVVLLDEPFAAVDERTTRDLLGLLHRWHDQGRTVVAVLHDLEQVRTHFPLTLLLAREPVAWGPTAQALTPAHWQQALRLHEPFDEHADHCAVHVDHDHAGEGHASETAEVAR